MTKWLQQVAMTMTTPLVRLRDLYWAKKLTVSTAEDEDDPYNRTTRSHVHSGETCVF